MGIFDKLKKTPKEKIEEAYKKTAEKIVNSDMITGKKISELNALYEQQSKKLAEIDKYAILTPSCMYYTDKLLKKTSEPQEIDNIDIEDELDKLNQLPGNRHINAVAAQMKAEKEEKEQQKKEAVYKLISDQLIKEIKEINGPSANNAKIEINVNQIDPEIIVELLKWLDAAKNKDTKPTESMLETLVSEIYDSYGEIKYKESKARDIANGANWISDMVFDKYLDNLLTKRIIEEIKTERERKKRTAELLYGETENKSDNNEKISINLDKIDPKIKSNISLLALPRYYSSFLFPIVETLIEKTMEFYNDSLEKTISRLRDIGITDEEWITRIYNSNKNKMDRKDEIGKMLKDNEKENQTVISQGMNKK